MIKPPVIVQNDPWLQPFAEIIYRRQIKVYEKEKEIAGENSTLSDFATGYLYFGLHRIPTGWIFREWAPNATKIFMIGEFSKWAEKEDFRLNRLENDVWEIWLPENKLNHGDLFKLSVHWDGGQGYRLPSYIRRVIQHEDIKVFDAQVWAPPEEYQWKFPAVNASGRPPFIYEAHVGMSTPEEKIGSFEEFRVNILPRIKKAGYNTIQLMAIQEHPYYGSFGYHVSNFFAVSSRFGTPTELKQLIDEAHGMDIAVIMDLVHSHSVKNEMEGLGNFDGTPYQYFHAGPRREHIAWDSLCFDYGKNEV
ncbi:MAG: 1,4-alpha-glucan-branching enzyme, partial [Bacteroidales bacterium]|nr:1,4-alpha-glucan-branching enzyme [Bacteroidales bacterium]